jgi:hypothetical protein
MGDDCIPSVIESLEYLGNPYTLKRRWRRLPWWLSDWGLNTYIICYHEQPIREISDSRKNAQDFVDLLNRAYQTGIADHTGFITSKMANT